VEVHFAIDDTEINKHEWQSAPALLAASGVFMGGANVPQNARAVFFTATTPSGLMVSSPVLLNEKADAPPAK
jgi:hypothetical protein